MANMVTITIDGTDYDVPEGMNLVDAAKRYAGMDIPVFCYHPKLGHDGNCRMCLIELATPRKNRDTGEMELAWFPTLQTACTQRTSQGMTIKTTTDKVVDGRREILEFLLSSHPLDCPICDKGGECPLQNLTMRHGPGTSRMYWTDKMHLGKHQPLGELIYLDQERCILCARCIRFQDKIADDPVLNFDYRGRKQQIITSSEPGFDSIFSGNTTDICPVGALTTADFRFNARPWEMVPVASVCTQCPVGCNITFDTRTDREAGGRTTIRRVMPRQNEAVNEIWMCDRGRFVHHYMEADDRLTTPLVRKGGKLVEATWDEALTEVVAQLRSAGADVAAIAGGRLSNEDYYAVQKLIRAQGSHNLATTPVNNAGGEFAAQFGVGVGTNLLDLGEGDAILVVASDLHQEAPVWWLRVIAAAKRGATLIVANGRRTQLDEFAVHSLRYDYGSEMVAINDLLGKGDAAKIIAEANNVIAFVGSEGLDAAGSKNVAQAAANLLASTGHVGTANNGLIVVWGEANGQGASDMGFRPDYLPGYQPVESPGKSYADILAGLADNSLKTVYIVGSDPAFDDPDTEDALRQTKGFVIVQDMFLTRTAELADVVLPSVSVAEREGTYTSGERRVQRTYPALEPVGEARPDWWIAGRLVEALGHDEAPGFVPQVLAEIAAFVPAYAGITYPRLAQVEPQFPDVSGEDLYFGGTAFINQHGLGAQVPSAAERGDAPGISTPAPGQALKVGSGQLVVVPINLIYDQEPIVQKTEIVQQRVPLPHARLNPQDAVSLGVEDGDMLAVTLGEREVVVAAYLDESLPVGVATLPRQLQPQGAPLSAVAAPVKKLEKVEA
jgi:NADH-quinone oxidoreductase subunit G